MQLSSSQWGVSVSGTHHTLVDCVLEVGDVWFWSASDLLLEMWIWWQDSLDHIDDINIQ